MKRSLDRVLRVRRLQEGLAELDFAGRQAEMRALEQGAASQRRLARSVRSATWQLLPSEATPGWLLGMSDAEILVWKGDQLAAAAEGRQQLVDAARSALLARRLDRRQLEMLAAAAERNAQREARRREQKAADDWFQSVRRRRK